MTKKDFELIASILRSYRGEIPERKLDDMAESFAYHLSLKNNRFNRALFVEATKESENNA